MPETLTIEVSGPVARLTLNRPDVHNAMNQQMVQELLTYFTEIQDSRAIRVVVLAAAGKTFCAGGDIKDMTASFSMPFEQQVEEMMRVDSMLQTIATAPQVTITRIQGTTMGGGMGLVAATDISIASESAKFGLPEVRLGVAPALISPYVIARLGISRARQLMLTGRRFNAQQALEYGFVHEICSDDELDKHVNATVGDVLKCAPNALAETKKLIDYVTSRSLPESSSYRAELITRLRSGEEGQEGMMAFVQKRKPSWDETQPG